LRVCYPSLIPTIDIIAIKGVHEKSRRKSSVKEAFKQCLQAQTWRNFPLLCSHKVCWILLKMDIPHTTSNFNSQKMEKKELKKNKMKGAKTLFLIQQGVAENIFSHIINETKSKDAWDMLQ
jgi:hypothetical protein